MTLLSVCRKLPPGDARSQPHGPQGAFLVLFPELPPWKPGRQGVWPLSGRTVGGWVGGEPRGGPGGTGCERLAGVPTHQCTSGRPSGGRTSGGSRTWGPCPCPHSCAGSLRFHSYRLLVRPRVHVRVYKQNNKND